jgi:hypothetical protein
MAEQTTETVGTTGPVTGPLVGPDPLRGPLSRDIPLNSEWNIYNHIKCDQNDYIKCTNLIGTCSTVFEFWTCYNELPKPSEFFYQKETGKPYYYTEAPCGTEGSSGATGLVKREISSVSCFRKNVSPVWEDPLNKPGGELELRLKNDTNIDFLDKSWLHLCVNCMSENLSEKVTGFRFVDSSIIPNQKPLYRVEIWLSDNSVSAIVEEKFRKLLSLDASDKIIYKKHS